MLQYSKWMSLSLPTRIKIANHFGIPKLRSTHVSNDVVIDDGYNVKDIENALTIEALQNHLNSVEDDFNILLVLFIDVLEGRASLTQERVEKENIIPGEVLIIKKRGRPSKK